MDTATSRAQLCSEHDFALDIPGFHDELARLRRDHPVAFVPYLQLAADAPTRFVGSVLRGPDTLPVTFTGR